jgi:Bacterial regulatory helix-turn-helix protein, lysR family
MDPLQKISLTIVWSRYMPAWTLDQLRTFVAVASAATMTAAADELGYTTGAVSEQMAALEAAAGKATVDPYQARHPADRRGHRFAPLSEATPHCWNKRLWSA